MTRKEIALRLAQLRIKKDISANEMSLKLGQNAGYISRIENNKFMPSIDRLSSICDFLEISESDFFDNGTQYPKEYLDIVNNLKKLDDESFKLVKVLIQKLAK